MLKPNDTGAINALLIPLILISLFLVGAGAFGVWAYQGRQDYKNNVDTKIAVASEKAVKAEDIKKDTAAAEAAKDPFKVYNGPDSFGALHISFPKTWSAYVDESGAGDTGVNGYFYPNVVPALTATTSSFALRAQVLGQSYNVSLHSYEDFVKSKKGTVTPYTLPKLPSVVGTRLDGEIVPNKQGSMIILPLRDKTLKVWTESQQFESDFNNNILPNLTFSP